MTNINDLTKQQLNTLAALGQGWEYSKSIWGVDSYWVTERGGTIKRYDPCNNWSQAGELLEQMAHIDFYSEYAYHYPKDNSMVSIRVCSMGSSRKALIVRAFVASRYGTEIDFDAIVGGE